MASTPSLIGFGDADSFYASAEVVRRPWLQGVPVGVLGNQGACVIARDYKMKACGVKVGHPVWEAKKLCPDGVYLKRDFHWYEAISRKMLAGLPAFRPRPGWPSMLPRHAISDADWARIERLLPGRPGQPGWVATDNRLFFDAVLWIGRTGVPWRDLPARFGKWNSAWRRFDLWATKGTWQIVFDALQDPDLEWLIVDSTVIRAHPCAAGAKKKADGTGGQDDQALGRSRGGFGTKTHGAVSRLGLPARLILTGGQASDVGQAIPLIEGVPFDQRDRRSRVRLEGGRGGGGKGRRRGGHPEPEERGGSARDRLGAVQGSELGGAVLVEGETVPAGGDAVREEGLQLFGVRPSGLHHDLAAIAQKAKDPQKLFTRPRS